MTWKTEAWIQKLPIAGSTPVKSWTKNIDSSRRISLTATKFASMANFPVGAYLLEAKSGSLSARELILVSDATLVVKSSTKQALVFFADALTGAPIANANVALWESYYKRQVALAARASDHQR